METYFTTMKSPAGDILIAGTDNGLTHIKFMEGKKSSQIDRAWTRDDDRFHEAAQQLNEYFDGTRKVFDLPLAPAGTSFQLSVWNELQRIPWGQTTTYGALAAKLDMPTAARAVGAANGQNPLAIVVPCHRVIGSDGALTGYAAGLPIKRQLLELENVPLEHATSQLQLL